MVIQKLIATFSALFLLCLSGWAAEIPAPRSDLRPVPVPALSDLEGIAQQQLGSAENALRQSVSSAEVDDSQLSEAYGRAGVTYHAYGFTETAEACYLNASRLRPLNFAWAYLLARLYHSEGKARQALTWYLRGNLIRADYPAFFVSLGDFYLETDAADQARISFETALSIEAKEAAAMVGLGRIALAQKEYEIAIGQFRKALQIAPYASRVHHWLADAYQAVGDLETAQQHLRQSGNVEVQSEDPIFEQLAEVRLGGANHLIRGRRAFDGGDFEAAIQEFRKAVDAAPESAPARINLGSALAQQGAVQEAVTEYRKALELKPNSLTAHYNLGLLYSRSGQFQEAETHLRYVVERRPNDSEVHYTLAENLMGLGNQEEALTHCRRTIELNPNHQGAILAEVQILAIRADYATALERLEEAHSRLPDQGRIAHALARLLAACPDASLRQGQRALDLALRVYKAVPLVSHAVTVAQALAELGRCEEAAQWQAGALKGAEEGNEPGLAERLKTALDQYKAGPPCRP